MFRILLLCSIFISMSCDTARQVLSQVTGEDEIAAALRQALDHGVDKAVKELSRDNGFLDSPYKILLPEEARKVVEKVKFIPGFENVERSLIEKMNEAAEIAAAKASPIFLDAIKQMTIRDATDILMGNDDAATRYLERTTRNGLYQAFLPVIQSSLDEVRAREYWTTVVDAYNKIPLVKKVNPELDDHVNNKGLDGLFALIEKKEDGIRNNLNERTTDLLRRVFARQDD